MKTIIIAAISLAVVCTAIQATTRMLLAGCVIVAWHSISISLYHKDDES